MGLLSRIVKVAAGEQPSARGLLSRVGMGAAGLGGAAYLMAPEPDRVMTPADPEIEKTRAVVSELQNDLNTFDNGSPEEVQKALMRKGFPLKKVDGIIGPETSQAIGDFKQQTLTQLKDATERLQQLESQQRQHNAYEATAPSDKHEMLREFGWIPATVGAVALGTLTRGGAVKKAAAEAAKKIANADALLTTGAVARGAASPKGLTSRAANLNEFWQLGGADGQVPFKTLSNGEMRPKGGAMSPADLFPAGAKHVRSNDIGMIGSGLGEAGLSTAGLIGAQSELDAAQAAADAEPTEANLARLERARDLVALTQTMARVGLGFAGGRAFGALKMPYASARPNMAGAEAERALLLQAINRTRGP